MLSATAAGMLLSLVSFGSAGALPVTPLSPSAGTPEVILVEGGCGPGWFRNEFGKCRPERGPVVVAPGAVVVAPAAPVVVAPAPVVCATGMRWHPRFRRCVVL